MKRLHKIAAIAFCVTSIFGHHAFAGADVTIEDIDPSTAEVSTAESDKSSEILASYEGNLLNIQERLAAIGYFPSYMVDGKNIEVTKRGVARFQKDYGLKADGVFGPDTATALNYYTGTQHIVPVPHYKTVYHYALPSFYAN